jgi:hypothetical protein
MKKESQIMTQRLRNKTTKKKTRSGGRDKEVPTRTTQENENEYVCGSKKKKKDYKAIKLFNSLLRNF